MSQPDNYTPQVVTGSTATLDVVLLWTFDGISELEISQTDGTTVKTLSNGDFTAVVNLQTVTVENAYGDGNVTTITVSRNTKKTQEFTQSEQNPLDADALNAALDKIVRMIQENGYTSSQLSSSVDNGDLSDLLAKAITSDDPFEIPAKEGRSNVWLGFDENGNLLLSVPNNVDPPDGPANPEDFLTVLTDIKIVTATNYTLIDSDTGKFIILSNTSDITVNMPDNLSLGHQVMFMKTASDNAVTHTAQGGANIVNQTSITASKQYAWYSSTLFENAGGNAAKYKFIGEIDSTDINNIEEVSRSIILDNTMTIDEAQAAIDAAGRFLNEGVELKILFQDGAYLYNKSLTIGGFTGPGVLTIGSLTTPAFDYTARPVQITNTNTPNVSEYTLANVFDNFTVWEAFRNNSALFISGNSCSQVGMFGLSLSSKVFPCVITSSSALMYIRGMHFNQVGAFTRSAYNPASGLLTYGGGLFLDTNVFTTDTDTDGMNMQGCQMQLNNSSGNGGYLVQGVMAVSVSEASTTSNNNFTSSISKYSIFGTWTSGAITE